MYTFSIAGSWQLVGLVLMALLASGCGGGDKKTEPPPAPSAPSLTVTTVDPKTLRFSWSPVSYASHYKLLKNEGGSSGYSLVSEQSTTSATETISVHLHDWVNTRYLLEACNASGCSRSVPVFTTDAMLAAIGSLRVDTPVANDYLGYSLALSGDGQYLAAGVTNRDSLISCEGEPGCVDTVNNTGSVVIFRRQNNNWVQDTEISAASGMENADHYFGYALSLSHDGHTLAVGTPFESSGAQGINGDRKNTSAQDSGAVYVFVRSGNQWQEQAYIKASNAEAYDYFGSSLQLSTDGDLLVIGAPGEASKAKGINGDQSDNSVGLAGAVYVYERSGNNWDQTSYIKASNQVYLINQCFNPSPVRCLTTHGRRFGSSLALSHDATTLVIGAIYDHTNAGGVNVPADNWDAPRSGAAYVFTREESGWLQSAYIKSSDNLAHNHFGHRVALSGNGDLLAISSIKQSLGASDLSASNAGAVYVFARESEQWLQQAYIKASNAMSGHEFGSSLAFSKDGIWLAVGASNEASNAIGIDGNQSNQNMTGAGAAYLFRREGNAWEQYRYIKAPVSTARLGFGFSLGLSDDGRVLAVGAMGAAAQRQTGTALSNAGVVYLY